MATRRYPQFILLGDSIIQNGLLLRDGVSLVAGLAEHCQRRMDIVNRGLSGYNTANALVVLEELIPPPSSAKVDLLLVLFGANDACLPSSPTKQHVSIEKYRENLKAIITNPSIAAHNATILLVTPPPVNEHQFADKNRIAEVTAEYAKVVREVAAEFKDNNVVLIDLWTALMKQASKTTPSSIVDGLNGVLLGSHKAPQSAGLGSLLTDGLHLTGAGYLVFLNEVIPEVGKEWASEPLDNPSWIFPHWSIAPRND